MRRVPMAVMDSADEPGGSRDRRRRPAHTAGCGLSRSYVASCSGVRSVDRRGSSGPRPAARPVVSPPPEWRGSKRAASLWEWRRRPASSRQRPGALGRCLPVRRRRGARCRLRRPRRRRSRRGGRHHRVLGRHRVTGFRDGVVLRCRSGLGVTPRRPVAGARPAWRPARVVAVERLLHDLADELPKSSCAGPRARAARGAAPAPGGSRRR